MKYLFLIILLISNSYATSADESKMNTYKSITGYSFRYPKCWKVQSAHPSLDENVETSKNLELDATPECNSQSSSNLSMLVVTSSGSRTIKKNKTDIDANIKCIRKKCSPNYLYMGFKKNKDATYFDYASPTGSNGLRWETIVYCKDFFVSFAFTDDSASDEIHKNIKSGNYSAPKHLQQVIESFKCSNDRLKSSSGGNYQLTFKSKFGYQIQYPACLEISPIDIAYESEADLECLSMQFATISYSYYHSIGILKILKGILST